MFTSLYLNAILGDLKNDYNLAGGRLQSIKSSSYGFYLFKISTDVGRVDILIDHTNKVFMPIFLKEASSKKDTHLAMFIKRNLLGAKIMDFRQLDLDRIIKISLSSRNSTYHIYIELYGKGNIILTDASDIVISAVNEFTSLKRVIKKGLVYKPPEQIPLSYNFLINYIKSKRELFKTLPIDPLTINYILYLLRKDDINIEDPKVFLNPFLKKLEDLKNSRRYTLIKGSKNDLLILPYKPAEDFLEKMNKTVLFATEDYIEFSNYFIRNIYKNMLIPYEIKYKIKKIDDDLKKINNKIIELNKKYNSYINNVSKLYSMVDQLYSIFREVKAGIGNYKVDNRRKVVYIMIDDIEYALPYTVNPYKAISIVYDEIKKIKDGIEKLKKRRDELENLKRSIEYPDIFKDQMIAWRRRWFEKYIWSLSYNGLLIIGGKDARMNETIVKKYAAGSDLIFHAEIRGSPFVILKNGLQAGDEHDLYDAALITAAYSKAWQLQLHAISVYYVTKDQVSKKAPSGEYLKTGSFMIYGKRNYITGVPLELYVAVADIDQFNKILIGSKSSICKYAVDKIFFKLIPGELPRSRVAREIVEYFVTNNLLDKHYYDAYYSDLINRLPGNSSLVKIKEC